MALELTGWWRGRTDATAAQATRVIATDPFGFFPGAASRVAGLGGAGPLPQPTYLFHTPHLPAPSSRLRLEGRFDGLDASAGVLVLEIMARSPGSSAPSDLVVRKRLKLRRLARGDGRFAIECDAAEGVRYAALGHLAGDGEARARGLDLCWIGTGDPYPERDPDLFRIDPADPLADLYAIGPATLKEPVSQPCTARQLTEPAYLRWIERLREPPSRHRKQWEFVFILRALEQHGCLRPGARGLGFGVGREPLPAIMAAMGVDVLATDLPAGHGDALAWRGTGQHADEVRQLSRPDICDDERLFAQVGYRPVDMRAIPADLTGFDFTWSACALEHLGSIEAGLRFIEDSVGCLRPGGVAVHTTELNLSFNTRTLATGATVLFRRQDIERLAQRLRAAGHWIAPIKLDPGDQPLDAHVDLPPYTNDPHLKLDLEGFVTTSFGLIVRKGGGAPPD